MCFGHGPNGTLNSSPTSLIGSSVAQGNKRIYFFFIDKFEKWVPGATLRVPTFCTSL